MIVKSTLLYAPAIMAPRAAAFLLVLLLTHRLGPVEFGYYVLVLLVGDILDMTATSWIRLAFLRTDVSTPGAWRNGFAKSAPLVAGSTAIACAAAWGFSVALTPDRILSFALVVSAYVVSNSVLRLGLTALQLQGRRADYSTLEVVRAVALVGFGWTASGIWPNFSAVSFTNAAVTSLLALITILRALQKMPPGQQESSTYRARIIYGMPIIALTFVGYMVTNSDRLILKILAGAASVGIYAAAYSIARTPIDIIGNAVNQGGFPEMMRRHDQDGTSGASSFLRQSFELMSLLQLTVLGLITGLSTAAAAAVLPKAFGASAILMPVIAAGGCVMGFKSYVFDNIFHATKTNWLQVGTYVPAGLSAILACYILIPHLGPLGAAFGFLIGASIGLLTSVLLASRFVKIRLSPWEFGKSFLLALVASLTSQLAWRAASTTLSPFPALVTGGLAAGVAWLVALLLLRPAIFASGIDKAFSALKLRPNNP